MNGYNFHSLNVFGLNQILRFMLKFDCLGCYTMRRPSCIVPLSLGGQVVVNTVATSYGHLFLKFFGSNGVCSQSVFFFSFLFNFNFNFFWCVCVCASFQIQQFHLSLPLFDPYYMHLTKYICHSDHHVSVHIIVACGARANVIHINITVANLQLFVCSSSKLLISPIFTFILPLGYVNLKYSNHPILWSYFIHFISCVLQPKWLMIDHKLNKVDFSMSPTLYFF